MRKTVTKQKVEELFLVFANKMGYPCCNAYNIVSGEWVVGAIILDLHKGYGYVLEEVSNEQGAVSHPFGSHRRTHPEMYDCLSFAIDTLRRVEDFKDSHAG